MTVFWRRQKSKWNCHRFELKINDIISIPSFSLWLWQNVLQKNKQNEKKLAKQRGKHKKRQNVEIFEGVNLSFLDCWWFFWQLQHSQTRISRRSTPHRRNLVQLKNIEIVRHVGDLEDTSWVWRFLPFWRADLELVQNWRAVTEDFFHGQGHVEARSHTTCERRTP